ncbi:acyl carrier protein [Acetobacter peroxydans]|uniref:acyl carrier protein n=1 Tax=Acetobacter peroxydans TaxID=104098 RepID=UPI0011434960|nr:acyl carrier protein [Acetobacter peroxydans]NHO16686.1 hypothetical protein [Acetobacter peroxydans]
MSSSLGLLGDSDDLALIEDVEEAFGFRLSDCELNHCRTVGDLFELVEARLPTSGLKGNCATAMTFYRLRRAIQPRIGIALRPGTSISALSTLRVKELHRIIKEECGLRPPVRYISVWGAIALLAIFALPVAVVILDLSGWIAILSALLATVIFRKMPIRLPHTMLTFGDLVRSVSSRSVGTLAEQGARLRPAEAWDAFRDILSGHTPLSKEAITPETLLLHPKVANS